MLQHVRGYDSRGKRSPLRANTEPHPRNEIAPVQQKRLTSPQHVPRHIPGHATKPPKPLVSTYQGTKPTITVPRAVLQHVRGYETQGKRSPSRANTEPHPRNEIAPVQQKRLTAPQHVPGHIPGHATVPLRSQHVSGHETDPNCSPRRATARARLRNARKTFPAAC